VNLIFAAPTAVSLIGYHFDKNPPAKKILSRIEFKLRVAMQRFYSSSSQKTIQIRKAHFEMYLVLLIILSEDRSEQNNLEIILPMHA